MDSRREIAERVIARWDARGRSIDTHPQFRDLIELWISGEIAMSEIRWRYLDLLKQTPDDKPGEVSDASGEA
jgi:hypothetical protein